MILFILLLNLNIFNIMNKNYLSSITIKYYKLQFMILKDNFYYSDE